MKAQAKGIDLICILMCVVILLFFLLTVLPSFLDVVLTELVGSSAEVVARQSSGLITLLGATTYDAQLSYRFAENVLYSVSIDGRTIKITPHYKTSFAEKSPATTTVGIELGTYTLEDVNGIKVVKTVRDHTPSYKVESYG
ncbi:MAG: hypothetical protein ACTSUF_00745 [Candidatus Heimdallarchaeaceae archaeon]